MITWVQSFAWRYDLAPLNAGICFLAAFACIWVSQCMVRIPRAPLWALWSIVVHRLMLLVIACSLMLAAASPYLSFDTAPGVGDVVQRAAFLVMLLVWPASSRARRRYGPHP